jgi:hypothetical protein
MALLSGRLAKRNNAANRTVRRTARRVDGDKASAFDRTEGDDPPLAVIESRIFPFQDRPRKQRHGQFER